MKFHKDGTMPPVVWVFGSNLAGRHGKGAAEVAYACYQAKWGLGVGPQGSAYAIPTKDYKLRTLPLGAIEPHIKDFLRYAASHPELEFFVTSVGCGLAGYKPAQIAPMFNDAPDNCDFPDTWREYLTDDEPQREN